MSEENYSCSKKLFRALVIDDDIDRSGVYHGILDKYFDVRIINSLSEIGGFSDFEIYDLLLMDLYLGGDGMSEENTAFQLIDRFEFEQPIFIITSQYITEKYEINTYFLRANKYKNILDVLAFKDISNAQRNFREKIYSEFCLNRGYINSRNKERITILQISDLQFGSSKSAFVDGIDRQISEYLKENSLQPDLLVIAGDIAESGDAGQYKDADKWIKKFAEKLWGNDSGADYSNRIVMVPGNHDYDLQVSASDTYQLDFESETQNTYMKKENPISFTRQKLGFANYIRFMADFYHDDKYFRYIDKPVHIDDRFRSLGIRFVTYNSAFMLNASNYKNESPKYTTFDGIEEEELESGTNSDNRLCNILLIHNPVRDYLSSDSKSVSTSGRMSTFIQNNKLHMCLCGHTHSEKPTTFLGLKGQYAKNMICISSGSLMLSQDKLQEGSSRGFCVIQLNKGLALEDSIMENIIVSVKPRYFKFDTNSIRECTKDIEPAEKAEPESVYKIFDRDVLRNT